ncbi:MAG: hypothetical protein U9N86_04470 [Bacteroidota bacterium]|nr:hypothetical protein [Bacteroidota bacterium]
MKKFITLILILLPLAAIAQKGNTTTVAKFFNKYCEYPNYSSIEITEDMFQMFGELEDADSETVTFFKKLKYVRFMEYEAKGTTIVAGVSGGKESNYYVDGQQVSTTGKASNITPIQSIGNSVVYNRAIKEINFAGFTKLMKSNQDGEKLLFLRRKYTTNPNDQEFVLLNGNTLIQIRGDINIKHLYEMEEILEAIGEILPL